MIFSPAVRILTEYKDLEEYGVKWFLLWPILVRKQERTVFVVYPITEDAAKDRENESFVETRWHRVSRKEVKALPLSLKLHVVE